MLSSELIKVNLRNLGRHPITLQHAMLAVALAGKDLINVDALTSYPHLMDVDISNNSIESLASFSGLPTLIELNARCFLCVHAAIFL